MILKISQRKPHRTTRDVGVCLGRRDNVQRGHRKIPRNPVSSSCDSHPARGGGTGRDGTHTKRKVNRVKCLQSNRSQVQPDQEVLKMRLRLTTRKCHCVSVFIGNKRQSSERGDPEPGTREFCNPGFPAFQQTRSVLPSLDDGCHPVWGAAQTLYLKPTLRYACPRAFAGSLLFLGLCEKSQL